MDKTSARALLESMLKVRRFEEALIKLFEAGAYRGHCHVYIGQEACGTPALNLMISGDISFSTHRNHGHYIANKGAAKAGLAEILGRVEGIHGGRTGSAHLSNPENGLLWSTGLVGGSLGMAIGGAWPLKVANNGNIAVAFFGDGALEEGIAYEALNVASLEKLPILFICENNSIGAIGMSAGEWPSSTLNAKHLTDIPSSLCIPTEIVDGGDAFATYELIEKSIAHIRAGNGPIFIECQTMRWPGTKYAKTQLATGETNVEIAWDPNLAEGEHQEWMREADPIIRFIRGGLEKELFTQDEITQLDKKIQDETNAARDEALASPFPNVEDIFKNTFAAN